MRPARAGSCREKTTIVQLYFSHPLQRPRVISCAYTPTAPLFQLEEIPLVIMVLLQGPYI